jgi:anti-sigma factor RsiW
VQCAESLRVQAYFDGEVDAISAAEIERHAERCPDCREQLQDLERIRAAFRENLSPESASPELRTRIARALDEEIRSEKLEAAASRSRPDNRPTRSGRPFWLGLLSGVGGSAVAAALAMMMWLPASSNAFLDELATAHMRSLMPEHLIDVVSSDRHTVKPWFAGHTDVSPTVVDFAAQGFVLVGGRADYLNHQRAAVVVYKHGAHVINVFSWDAGTQSVPGNTTRDGYRMLFWKVGDLGYCAVSDSGWDELAELARLLRSSPAA